MSRAARLYGAAQALFETTDYRIPPFDQAEFDRHIQITREQLGEAAFEALAAEGRALTLEQAIELALQETGPAFEWLERWTYLYLAMLNDDRSFIRNLRQARGLQHGNRQRSADHHDG